MTLFVAGTDTGVGKTVVSALLVARYGGARPLGYWKPVATGAADERDRATVEALVPGVTAPAEAYLFADPVSPHLAARREGVPIELARIAARYSELRAVWPGHAWVVEGAGGLLVPLDDEGTLQVELVGQMAAPLLLVARSTLGTINHTLLSLEAARRRSLAVAGVALSGPPNADNREAIERFGEVPVLAELPRVEPLTLAALQADPAFRIDDLLLRDLFASPDA
jgi:dethiobiotin synthase